MNINISYSIHEGKDSLLDLKEEWNELYSRAYDSHGFLSYPWLSVFLKENRFSGIPTAFAMRDNKKLIALIFFEVKKLVGVRLALPLGHSEVSFWGMLYDFPGSDFLAMFAAGLNEQLKLKLLYIDDLYSKDDISKQFINELAKLKYIAKFQKRDVCLSINFVDNFEVYYHNRKTNKQRKKIEKKMLSLSNYGDVAIEKFRGKEVKQNIIDRLYKIQLNSWLINRGIKTLNDTFIKSIIASLGDYDYIRAWILKINDKDVAFRLGFKSHSTYYAYWTAFDEKYASLRPGLYLNKHVLEDCCNEGIKHYEFMHGEGEHKRFWQNEENYIERVILYKGLSGLLLSIQYRVRWILVKIKILRKIVHKLRVIKGRVKAS